jgi:hypothetical protein
MRQTVKCKCGAVYERSEYKVSFRDRDSFSCYICEMEIETWSGSRIPQYRLVHDPRKEAPSVGAQVNTIENKDQANDT